MPFKPGSITITQRDAIGVVGAIIPWNVPLFIAALKLGPAILTGCTVILKPAPETPLDSYLLAEAAIEAGLPVNPRRCRNCDITGPSLTG